MKATRIAYSKALNKGKLARLEEQAKRLGHVRSEIWQRFGSINGVDVKDRQIRDGWLKEGKRFDVPANAWKETLRDAKANIAMTVEAAKVKARQAIKRRTSDKDEQKRLYKLLKSNQFATDAYLSRIMRKYLTRGHNHTHNQIIVRSDQYTTFQKGGRAWIKVPSLEKGKRIAIPLNTTIEPSGTLRLILRDDRVEVHYTINVEQTNDCGSETLGVDKGYTEAFVDSDGEHHGIGLGALLATESDYLKNKNQRRARIRAIAKNTENKAKRQRIFDNNLGRKKLNRRASKQRSNIRDIAFKAAHAVVDKASVVAAEDLTASMNKKKFGKNTNRRLNSWTKGYLAEALNSVCQRRGSTLVLVSCAFTSQMDSRNGLLLGKRQGDSFYCFDGVVLQADENAARNVKARLCDPDIGRWTSYKKVKSILLERTKGHRLGLLSQDSSCTGSPVSTESESPNHAQGCARF